MAINLDNKKYHTARAENTTRILVSRFRGIGRNNARKDTVTRKAAFSLRMYDPDSRRACIIADIKSQCRTFGAKPPLARPDRPSLSSVFLAICYTYMKT